MKTCWQLWLYENPLGAGGVIYQFWHRPALELGLTLLQSIYNEGVQVSGDDLKRLSQELDVLEAFWNRSDFSNETPITLTILVDGSKVQRLERFHVWSGDFWASLAG